MTYVFPNISVLVTPLHLSIPEFLPVTEEVHTPPLTFVWLPGIFTRPHQRKAKPKQPRPLLTWNKMSSPLRCQRITDLAKSQHSTVMDHNRGSKARLTRVQSTIPSLTVCMTLGKISDLSTSSFCSLQNGDTKYRPHTIVEK